jgi:hypothetical protein
MRTDPVAKGWVMQNRSDIAPNHVCLAWDSARRSRLIQDFVSIAEAHASEITGP